MNASMHTLPLPATRKAVSTLRAQVAQVGHLLSNGLLKRGCGLLRDAHRATLRLSNVGSRDTLSVGEWRQTMTATLIADRGIPNREIGQSSILMRW